MLYFLFSNLSPEPSLLVVQELQTLSSFLRVFQIFLTLGHGVVFSFFVKCWISKMSFLF